MNRRRCRSLPPWSIRDVEPTFYLELGDPLYVDDADVDLANYTIREVLRIPSSVVLFLDDKFVLKMRLATFDVERMVNFMRVASAVVPVPRVYKYGHSGNCTFILMELIQGIQLGVVQNLYHCSVATVMAKMDKQIDLAVQRLATVGLSHNDLVPRNIIISDSWEIIAIVDWDYCTLFNPAREYLQRLGPHIDQYSEGNLDCSVPVEPLHWNHSYLNQVSKSQSVMDILNYDMDFTQSPPLLRFPRQEILRDPMDPQSVKPRLLAHAGKERRIAILTATSHAAVQRLVESCDAGRIPNARICLVLSHNPEEISPFARHSFTGRSFPIIYLPAFRSVSDLKGKPWRNYDEEVMQSVVRERPDVVIQVGWDATLRKEFWDAMALPRLFEGDKRPVPFPVVSVGLPRQSQIIPRQLEEIIPWTYNALRRWDIRKTGYTVTRLRKGKFKLMYTREIELRARESFQAFEARMQELECQVVEEVAFEYLDGKEPILS